MSRWKRARIARQWDWPQSNGRVPWFIAALRWLGFDEGVSSQKDLDFEQSEFSRKASKAEYDLILSWFHATGSEIAEFPAATPNSPSQSDHDDSSQ